MAVHVVGIALPLVAMVTPLIRIDAVQVPARCERTQSVT